MPIFSLPSDFGIGTLGRDACDFIDFLAAADVHVWEIMPICHTDSSFSPHNALCARAGNPLLIDLQPFVDQGVFSSRELSRMDWGTGPCQDQLFQGSCRQIQGAGNGI